jgi:cytochrome c peroxidase
MFSDFKAHRIGGPQLAPVFGVGTGNVLFDGPGGDEDYGFFQTEGKPALRYTFRTAPLRNLKVASGYFHNDAYGSVEAAIKHHLDVVGALRDYDPRANGVPQDLRVGPYGGMLAAGLDPELPNNRLTRQDVADLTEFVSDGLFDERVLEFCSEIPASVPSGPPVQLFQGCRQRSK